MNVLQYKILVKHCAVNQKVESPVSCRRHMKQIMNFDKY